VIIAVLTNLFGLTNYSVTLRMATCFIYIRHHQAIKCCKNVDLKMQNGLSLHRVLPYD